MAYSIEPAYTVKNELLRLLIKASTNKKNQWLFVNGFLSSEMVESFPNTWSSEKFVVICEKEIICYFSASWSKPLNIIDGFSLILFNENKTITAAKALFEFIDYLFEIRGCNAFNWFVAEKNIHAKKIYDKFILHHFGHIVGKRTCGQMGYSGEISDIILYEITKEEFFNWKKGNSK